MVDTASGQAGFSSLRRLAGTEAAAGSARITVAALSPDWLDTYSAWVGSARPTGTAQHPIWLRAWSAHAASDIVTITAEADGAKVLMLPLEVVRQSWFTAARFIGGSHANANFPAVDPRWAKAADEKQIREIFRALHRARPDIDIVRLERMAGENCGVRSPLLAMSGTPSANIALAAKLEGGFEPLLHRLSDRKAKKHRAQQRRFEEAGGFRRIQARSPEEVDRLLSAVFAFKQQRFRAAGIPDVFAKPEVRAAFRAVFLGALTQSPAPFVLHGLEVGGTLRAVTGESRWGDRTICEFGGIAEDELSKHSPGEFLFYCNIEETAAEGRAFYDFGVGDEPYKRQWCELEMTHFDLAIPLSAKGKAATAALTLSRRAISSVKRHPTVWHAVKRIRRLAAGSDAAA